MSKKISLFFVLLVLVVLTGCSAKPVTLEVYAGISAKSAMLALKDSYEKQHPNVTVNFNFAASKTLEATMRALQQGDLYIVPSVDIEKMAQDGLIIESHPLASLTPALIVRKDSKVVTSWNDLAKDGVRLAIINPDLGTAGSIADKVIESSPAKDAIHSNITVFSTNINEMIQLLMDGKVDAFINWDVVAQTNPDLMAIEIPADINQKLEMWVAIPTYTSSRDDAAGFLEFIQGDEGQQAFKDAGFEILGE